MLKKTYGGVCVGNMWREVVRNHGPPYGDAEHVSITRRATKPNFMQSVRLSRSTVMTLRYEVLSFMYLGFWQVGLVDYYSAIISVECCLGARGGGLDMISLVIV